MNKFVKRIKEEVEMFNRANKHESLNSFLISLLNEYVDVSAADELESYDKQIRFIEMGILQVQIDDEVAQFFVDYSDDSWNGFDIYTDYDLLEPVTKEKCVVEQWITEEEKAQRILDGTIL